MTEPAAAPLEHADPRRVKKTFQLEASVVRSIERMAAAENRNVSNMVETLLKRAIAKHNEQVRMG